MAELTSTCSARIELEVIMETIVIIEETER